MKIILLTQDGVIVKRVEVKESELLNVSVIKDGNKYYSYQSSSGYSFQRANFLEIKAPVDLEFISV